MSTPATRTWVIESPIGDDGLPIGPADRDAMSELLADIEAVLFTVGGVVHIAADREEIGHAGGEPVFVTRGYVVQWRSFAPPRRAPVENGTPPAVPDELDELEAQEAP